LILMGPGVDIADAIQLLYFINTKR
jgi:hypothetical protein